MSQILDDIFNPKPQEYYIGNPNSTLFACGKNEHWELTFKEITHIDHPEGIRFSIENNIKQVSIKGSHTGILTEDGRLYMLGQNLVNKLGQGERQVLNISKPTLFAKSKDDPIDQVAVGENYTLSLFKNGEVWAWGGTLHKKASKGLAPSKIPVIDKFIITKIDCGIYHSMALSQEGVLFSWGGGGKDFNKGQLGHEDKDDIQHPKPIQFFQHNKVVNFACGEQHTLAKTEDNQVWGWGSGQFGVLGNGKTEDRIQPDKVIFEVENNIVEMAGGKNHSCFINDKGQLWTCGMGTQGQLGLGNLKNQDYPQYCTPMGDKYIEKVACGVYHTVILVRPHYVFTTGNNQYGQLGLNHLNNVNEFTWVEGLKNKNVRSVFAGGFHSLFLLDFDDQYVPQYRRPSPPKYEKNSEKSRNKSRNSKKSSFLPKGKLSSYKSGSITPPYRQKSKKKNFLKSQNQSHDSRDAYSINVVEPFDIFDEKVPFNQNINEQTQQKNKGISSTNKMNTQNQNQGPVINYDENSEDDLFKQGQITENFQPSQNNTQNLDISIPPGSDDNSLSEKQYNKNIVKIPPNNILKPQNKITNNNFKPQLENPFEINSNIQDQDFGSPIIQKQFNQFTPSMHEEDQKKKLKNIKDSPIHSFINYNINNRIQSEYYLFFYETAYNHKFFLIDYHLTNENKIVKRIDEIIQYIELADPKLITYKIDKYQNFKAKENNFLIPIQFDEEKPSHIGTYIVMLVQSSEYFEDYFQNSIPESDYSKKMVKNYKTTVTQLYEFDKQTIEKDKKWKILSKTAEIFIAGLSNLIESLRIYEVRSLKYKQQIKNYLFKFFIFFQIQFFPIIIELIQMSDQNKIQRKVKEIADRIFLEKFREKKDNQDYYVVSLEMKKFAQLYFTANFTGSKNITFLNGENYIQKTEVLPYTKKEVARLLLNKGWNLKTKFSFTLGLPSVEIQQEFLNSYEQEISSYLRVHKNFQNVDFISFKESQIQNYFQQKNTTFIDLDFPPMDSSIEKNKQKILQFYESLIHWRRMEEIVDNPPGKGKIPVLYEGINPTDVKTGKLQDYWLLSSISAISERPELVRKIILSKQYNKFGLYKVKLRKMGFWVTMVIDSYFPCFPEGNAIFGSSKNINEMWVLLIEKAFAKMYGRYGRLKTGKPNESLYDLTGYPVQTYRFYDKDIYNQITSGEFWTKLKKWDKLKYILTASTQDIKSSQVTGIVQEHTYTILDIQEHDDVKLLLLRNPWGVFEWNGDYSKESEKWTQSLIMKLKPDQIKDGSFWISYEHFLENYEILNVCKVKKWFEVALKGKFIKGIDSRYQLPYFCSRYSYKLSVLQKGKVIIGVHQEDERFKGVKETRPYIDIGIVIIKKQNGKYELIGKKDSEMEREVFFEINLTPGEYLVLPRSEGVVLNFQRENIPQFTYFDMSSKFVKSVVDDIFAKYDLDGNQQLTIDDVEKLFQKFGMNFDIKNFKEVLQGQKDWHIFTVYEFRKIFDYFLKTTDFEQQKHIFKSLGYDENLFSYRSRVISMTFHSSHSIQVENDDSFTQCLDMIARQLIIQKYGKNIDHIADDSNEHKEVEAYYYFNKRIHCYSYSVFNRTNQPITATLDLSESQNMITDHALKITKQIPPYTLEFIMSCQSKQKAEKYFRSAMLSWDQ